jgi:hypothetical protein
MASAAGTRPVVLTYEAPADCPSADWVVDRISALVRHQPSTPIAANVTITRYSGGYRLDLSVEEGRRRIVAESCDSLVQTLTVILALAIDPKVRDLTQLQNGPGRAKIDEATDSNTVAAGSSGPAPSAVTLLPLTPTVMSQVSQPVRSAPLPLSPPPLTRVSRYAPKVVARVEGEQNSTAVVKLADENQKNSNLELHPTLLLLTEYGMLPHIAHGPSLGLWIDKGIMSLALTAEWLMPVWTQMPEPNQSRGGHISFLGGEAGVCMSVVPSAPVRACAGVEAGDMLGKGSGVLENHTGQGIWLAGTAIVGLRPKILSSMGADVRLGLAIPMKRPAFGFEGYDWRYVPQPWSFRLMSGFSWL